MQYPVSIQILLTQDIIGINCFVIFSIINVIYLFILNHIHLTIISNYIIITPRMFIKMHIFI